MTATLVVGKPTSSAPGLRTYIAQLNGTPDFNRPTLMPRGSDRKTAVVDELMRVNSTAMSVSSPTFDKLKADGLIVGYSVLPFTNQVVIDVPDGRAAEAWRELNRVPGTGRIIRNREVQLVPFSQAADGAAAVSAPAVKADGPTIEWNVAKVNAPAVWAQGVRGQGVVVGTIDTGVDFSHPALHDKYRGLKADGTVDNNYSWFDAVANKTAPYDDNSHGSHVTGTTLGSTPDYNIGMAPDARWIGSKILSGSGSGTLAGVTKGLEWMLAPRDSAGLNADPTKAPDVVNNSWGTNDGKLTAFAKIWQAFIAAGIEPVVAAGNSGPAAGTVGAPGSYPESISVAATDKFDNAASFSSRGPSPIKGADGSDRKPDVAAPGVAVMSSIPGGKYASFSGTSMATPAVTGVVALLLSKYHDLTHDEVVKSLQSSAVDRGTPGYDYTYGYGRVDAAAALKAADALVAARPKPPTV